MLFLTAFSLSTAAENGIRVLLEDYLNIRSAPDKNASVVFVTGESTYAVAFGMYLDNSGDYWYKVKLPNGVEGYAFSSYVHEQSAGYTTDFDTENRVMLIENGVNVRSGPGTQYNVIASLWPCSLKLLGKESAYGATWYKVLTPGGLPGYIYGEYIAEYNYKTEAQFEESISAFPESYRIGLRYLHSVYPNWKFYADILDISFEEAVNAERGRKLISNLYDSLPESWRDSSSQTVVEEGYRPASAEALAYFMNPANFICEKSVFMFLKQSYDPATQNAQGVKSIVSGTFLDTDSYIEMIINAAVYSKLSPYIIAATILQEQGPHGSVACFGNYPGFEGYYNFFNYGASGETVESIIVSGLTYAKNNGWNSPQKAISEGAKNYASGYAEQNQDTYYYSDFNVINKSWNYQYATSIHDQVNKGINASSAYSNKNAAITFRIPVFKNSGAAAHTHSYDNGVVVKQPTSTTKGIKRYTCTVCGFIKEEPINPTDTPYGNKGDINGDGVLDTIDAALLRMYFLELKTFDEYQMYRADINGDGVVDTIDAALLRMHFLEIKKIK